MEEEPILKTRKQYWYIVFIWISSIGFGAIGVYIIGTSLEGKYPHIAGIALGLFFGVISFLTLISVFWLETIEIYADYILIISIFGGIKRKIYLDEILVWKEIKGVDKMEGVKSLKIYTRNKNFEINSLLYPEYERVKSILTNGKPEDKLGPLKRLKRMNRITIIVLVLIGLFCFYGTYYSFKIKDTIISSNEVVKIKGAISVKPVIDSKGRYSKFINIKLKEYPEITFILDGSGFDACYSKEFIKVVRANDTLYLGILISEYNKKITKRTDLDALDKENYEGIDIFSLSDNKYNYLVLDDYNRIEKRYKKLMVWLCCIAGIVCFGVSIGQFVKKGW